MREGDTQQMDLDQLKALEKLLPDSGTVSYHGNHTLPYRQLT